VAKQIIGQLMADDQRDFEKFVDLNLDILLHVDLEIPDSQKLVPIDGAVVTEHLKLNEASPVEIVKASNSPPWSEVVRRGKQRSKINKSCENEGCILEY
jgi:(p)ppGpp synthase/HD superfamily hydrolase